MGFFSKLFHRDGNGKEFPMKMENGALKDADKCMDKVLALKDDWVQEAHESGYYDDLKKMPDVILKRVINWALWQLNKSDDYALSKIQDDVFVKKQLDQTDVAVAIKILAYRNYGTSVLAEVSQQRNLTPEGREKAITTLLDLIGLTNQIGNAAQLSRRFYYGWRDYFDHENVHFEQVQQIASQARNVQNMIESTKKAKARLEKEKQAEIKIESTASSNEQTVSATVGNKKDEPEKQEEPTKPEPTLSANNSKPQAGITINVGEHGIESVSGSVSSEKSDEKKPVEDKQVNSADKKQENVDKSAISKKTTKPVKRLKKKPAKTPMLTIKKEAPKQDKIAKMVAETKKAKKLAMMNNDGFNPLTNDDVAKITKEEQDAINQSDAEKRKKKDKITITI